MYRVILADPPWPYGFPNTRKVKNGKDGDDYQTMKIQDIANLPIQELAADDSVCIMWAIFPQLKGALQVMESWVFDFVTGYPWIKTYDPPAIDMFGKLIYTPVWGMGMWVRGCSELILIGKRGNAKPPDTQWLGLIAERQAHSRKPESIYEYCESMPAPYLELFARRRREGWSVFGNQVEGSIRLPTQREPDEN
jgi:N6-adenosine-specific RNA methylase IME4